MFALSDLVNTLSACGAVILNHMEKVGEMTGIAAALRCLGLAKVGFRP